MSHFDAGTGCVSTLPPGHGHEDYIVGLAYNLPILITCGMDLGRFTDEAGPIQRSYNSANGKQAGLQLT